jgi:hypothetical protein
MATPSKIHVGAGNVVLNPDSVPIDLGLTSEGATFKYNGELEPIKTDQYLAPVGYYIPGEECSFETILSESGATAFKYAIGGGTITTQAPDAGQVGYDKIPFGGQTVLTDYVLEYRAPKRTNRSLYLRLRLLKVNISPNLEPQFLKDGSMGFKFTAMAVCDTTQSAGEQLGYWMEETAAATDGSPATLETSSIVPGDGASGIAVDTTIVVTFNRDIHPDSVNDGNFVLTEDDGTIVTTTVSQTDTDEVTITPSSDLSASTTTYLVSVSENCRALDDYSKMAVTEIFDFTTVA